MDRDRALRRWGAGLAAATLLAAGSGPAGAQLFGTKTKTKDAPPKAEAPADQTARIIPKEIPVSPNDAVALVNGEAITRQQLADEAVARKGKEVLEALIGGKLIDQAVVSRKLQITADEIEREADDYAASMGTTKENWLRTLDKERGISPLQFKRDILYRIVALRKVAEPQIQVTDEDLKKAYEAQYGEKLHYRIIMTANQNDAKAIWNELQQQPAAFENLARNDPRSIDTETKPFGGVAPHPMARHAYPLEVSKKAFRDLVDGEPHDKDPARKPKDGDLSGIIQVAESAWILLRRERVDPAQTYDPANENEKAKFRKLLHDVKLKDKMQEIYNELVENAAIDNKLTGEFRMAREEKHPGYRRDGGVKLMSNPDEALPEGTKKADLPKATAPARGSAPAAKLPPGVPPRPNVPTAAAPKK